MRSTALFAGLAAIAAHKVAGHATFQVLWINGVDVGGSCVRVPGGNTPIEDVSSNNIRCNANQGAPNYKCVVAAGSTVTVEMHQQPNDRSCATEAIGGNHYGPVLAYMSKVDNAITADGSSGWFKVFQDSWAPLRQGSQGSEDYWGTKDLNKNCGKMDLKIPASLPAGDYLLRAEAIALHSAQSARGAQFYMSCYQLTVTGGGSTLPPTVRFPGAYSVNDPGILVNIYQSLSTYIAPGPTVAPGGVSVQAGSGGSIATNTGGLTTVVRPTSSSATSRPASSSSSVRTSASPSPSSGGCTVAKYAQCGGQGWNGCTTCVAGSTCKALNSYYSQCT